MSEEILAGRNSVTEALRSGRSINKLLVQDLSLIHISEPTRP